VAAFQIGPFLDDGVGLGFLGLRQKVLSGGKPEKFGQNERFMGLDGVAIGNGMKVRYEVRLVESRASK
jgi:hypothetical protein